MEMVPCWPQDRPEKDKEAGRPPGQARRPLALAGCGRQVPTVGTGARAVIAQVPGQVLMGTRSPEGHPDSDSSRGAACL